MIKDLGPHVKKSLRAGVIGCGQIGSHYDQYRKNIESPRTHCMAYSKSNDFELVALCESHIERLAMAGERWQVKDLHTNLELFLKQNFDVISVCVPLEAQYKVLQQIAVNPPKVLFLEKPIGANFEDFNLIHELILKMAVPTVVNYSRRFSKELQKIKIEINNKTYGEAQVAVVNYDKGVLNNASHALDLLIYYFGNPYKVLYVDTIRDGRENQEDPTKSFVIWFKDRSGKEFKVCFNANNHNNYSIFEIDMQFELGRLKLINSADSLIEYRVKADEEYANYKLLYLSSEKSGLLNDCFSNSISELESLVRNKNINSVSSLLSSAIIHQVNNALKQSEALDKIIHL